MAPLNPLQIYFHVYFFSFRQSFFILDNQGKKELDLQRAGWFAPVRPSSSTGQLFENVIELPKEENTIFYRQVCRLQTLLTSRDSIHIVPTNLELGLSEKKILNCDVDLVASDPSNTTIPTLFSDDTDDKSRGTTILENSISNHREDEGGNGCSQEFVFEDIDQMRRYKAQHVRENCQL